MAALNNERVVQINFTFLFAVLTFYFAHFFDTGEPRLHKAFWFLLGSLATLQFLYVFLSCIIFGSIKMNRAERLAKV